MFMNKIQWFQSSQFSDAFISALLTMTHAELVLPAVFQKVDSLKCVVLSVFFI